MERTKLTGTQTRHWTPLENEFLAENELIEIVPSFTSETLHFLQVRLYRHPSLLMNVYRLISRCMKKIVRKLTI